jgi:hypothetical protein
VRDALTLSLRDAGDRQDLTFLPGHRPKGFSPSGELVRRGERLSRLEHGFQATAPRVFMKDIAVTGGWEMQIVRCEPGAQFPVHTHESPEFLFILEGVCFCAIRFGAMSALSRGCSFGF